MSTAIALIAKNTGTTESEITDVLRGMIISAKSQHGATATNAELAVVSGICSTYSLNPLTKEAYAFISGGKLQVVIGYDGFVKIMNRQHNFNGVEFEYEQNEKGDLVSVTTKIHVKGRDFPTCVTEWMDESYQPKSEAWRKYKRRMLRNKSLGQCVRLAFGVTELIEPDEAERIADSQPKDITPKIEVDFDAIEKVFAECGDDETLRQAASNCRADLEAGGAWDCSKAKVAAMRLAHKNRIEAMTDIDNDNDIVDVEFEEAVITETTTETGEIKND